MVKTNKNKLVKMAVAAEVNHPSAQRGYRTDYDGNAQIGLGMSGVKYNVAVCDFTYGMENEEHVEPGLSISNPNQMESSALGVLGCIGNEVKVTSGDAKGATGMITGKHGAFLVHFKQEDKEKIIPGDKMLVKAWGTGLKIDEFEEIVRVNKIDPELLEKMGIDFKD